VVQISAKLVFADDLYPGKQMAQSRTTLKAEGSPSAGCATGGTGGLVGLWALLGLCLVWRRLR
jgi:MYXO-CTERM domain-containing protein